MIKQITLLAVLLAVPGAPVLLADSDAPRPQPIEIIEFKFTPVRINARVGDTIVWTNRDLVPHTATAEDNAWTSGTLTNGAEGSLKLTTSGTFSYHCVFHDIMKGEIVVTAR